MPETLEDFLMSRPPTAERPLLGQTVLMVEDSRFACEALRMICQRSGARIRRADSLASAERHLRSYRPGIAVVDVGLPDGSGLELIEQLTHSDSPISVVLGISGDDMLEPDVMAAGAHGFLSKTITSIMAFQQAILTHLPNNARPSKLRSVDVDRVEPDRIALRDDFALAAELLTPNSDEATLDYLMTFLIGVAKSARDAVLEAAVDDVVTARGSGKPLSAAKLKAIGQMIDERLNATEPV